MLAIRHLTSPETVLLQVEAHTLDGHDFTGVDLSHAALAHASCREAVFQGATLREASFRGAILERANFTGADLSGADLFCSDLKDAVLRRADLSGANLHGADLRGADFFGALLSGADLTDVVCDERTRWPAGMANCPVPPARSGNPLRRVIETRKAGVSAVRPGPPTPSSGNAAVPAGETTAAAPAPWWDRGPRDARWSALVGAAVLLAVFTLLSTSRTPSRQGRAGSYRAGAEQLGTLPPASPELKASLPPASPAQEASPPEPALPQPVQEPLAQQQGAAPEAKTPVRKSHAKPATTRRRQRSAPRAIGRRGTVVLQHPDQQRPRTRRPARPTRLVRYAQVHRARRTHRTVAVVKRPYQPSSPAWNQELWFPKRKSAPMAASREGRAAKARFSRPRSRRPRAAGAEPKAAGNRGNSGFHYGSGYDIYRMHSDR